MLAIAPLDVFFVAPLIRGLKLIAAVRKSTLPDFVFFVAPLIRGLKLGQLGQSSYIAQGMSSLLPRLSGD